MNFHGFLGHLVAGGVLAALGVWHSLNTIVSYRLDGPSGFRAATWFPVPSPRLKHLELHCLLSFAALAAADQLLFGGGSLLAEKLAHATVFLLLAAYATAALAADRPTASKPDHRTALRGNAVAALAAAVFAQELFLLQRYRGRYSDGAESVYYWPLKVAAGVSLAATCATVAAPRSFAVAVVRSASLTFQGLWLVVTALWLWVPFLRIRFPSRWERDSERETAAALASVRLQVSLVLAAVWVGTAYLCTRPLEDHAQRVEEGAAKMIPVVESLVAELQERYVAAVVEVKEFLVLLRTAAADEKTPLVKDAADEETPPLKSADDEKTQLLPPVLEQATDVEKGEVSSTMQGEGPGNGTV